MESNNCRIKGRHISMSSRATFSTPAFYAPPP